MKNLKIDPTKTITLTPEACYLTENHHLTLKSESLVRINFNKMDIHHPTTMEMSRAIATFDRFEHLIFFKSPTEEGALVCKNVVIEEVISSFDVEYKVTHETFENFKKREAFLETEKTVEYELLNAQLLKNGKNVDYTIRAYNKKFANEYVEAMIKHAPKFGFTHVVAGGHFIMGYPVYKLIACYGNNVEDFAWRASGYGDVKVYDLKNPEDPKFIKYGI